MSKKNARPYRPRDANQLGKHIVDLATGQIEETYGPDRGAATAGVRGGKTGSHVRVRGMSSKALAEVSRKMVRDKRK